MRALAFLLLCSCAPSTQGPTRPAGGGACPVANVGPLVGYSYQAAPPPPPQGGAIPDGTYDLVQIIRHAATQGPWSSNQAPALRWVLAFKTTERSPNHVEGSLATAVEIPPARDCKVSRFATIGTEFRTIGGSKGIESTQYTAAGDAFIMIDPAGDGGVAVTYVFRRRN